MKQVIFLVTWSLITIAPYIEKTTTNDYGITSGNNAVSLAVYRFSQEVKEMQKEFKTEKEADEFIKKMPTEESFLIGSQYCKDAKKTKIIREVKK